MTAAMNQMFLKRHKILSDYQLHKKSPSGFTDFTICGRKTFITAIKRELNFGKYLLLTTF
jgi:hypothetical protein